MICERVYPERNFTPRLGQGELPDLHTYYDLKSKHFRRAGELWNSRISAYDNLLFASVLGETESLIDLIEKGDWRWLQRSRRYRNRQTKEVIGYDKYLDLRDEFTDALYPDVEIICTALIERDITVHEWVRRMAALIQQGHLAIWQFGSGGYNTIDNTAVVILQRTLRQQYDFLRSFGEDIIERNRSERQVEPRRVITEQGLYTRATMYIESITQSAERARTTTYGFHPDILPHYPGDGSMICLTRCRCHWRFIFPRGQNSFYHAYWTLRGGRPDGRNCATCLRYAQIYNPHTVVRF